MSFLDFITRNRRYLLYGFLLSFASSFGQTWFIGLFKEQLLTDFGLTHGSYGSWYAVATLSSAVCLGYLGRLVDSVDLRRYTLFVCAGLSLACLGISIADSLGALVCALFCLRLFGQGLASHLSSTATARYFDVQRGKALSIVSLGHPAGEAILPLSIVALLAFDPSWRTGWIACGAFMVLAITPTLFGLLRGHEARHEKLLEELDAAEKAGQPGRQWTTRDVLRDPGFYRLLPVVLAPAFINTGLMFHQDVLRASMDWSRELFASSFIVLSIAQVIAAPLAGMLVDRHTAARLLPIYLLPYSLALFSIGLFTSSSMSLVLMIGMGVAGGFAYPVIGGTWAERYGVKHLGAIRSMATVMMVTCTALAPPLLGVMIDRGVSMQSIALGLGAYSLVASAAVFGMRLPKS
ncbi:MAG: MFS family permease [Planctomycetota bacterium]